MFVKCFFFFCIYVTYLLIVSIFLFEGDHLQGLICESLATLPKVRRSRHDEVKQTLLLSNFFPFCTCLRDDGFTFQRQSAR